MYVTFTTLKWQVALDMQHRAQSMTRTGHHTGEGAKDFVTYLSIEPTM